MYTTYLLTYLLTKLAYNVKPFATNNLLLIYFNK